jgi:hypothetical protein
MGSIAMDKAGDIALGYSLSSATVLPSIAYTGRTPGDTLGMMETEDIVVPGLGSQGGGLNRWGDYSDMAVDPVDDCTFWYTTEYVPAGTGSFNWNTRIVSFKFPGCGSAPPPPDFTIAAAPSSQTVIVGSSTSYTATVSPLNGFNGTVTLSHGVLPSGVTLTFLPTAISGGSGSSTVKVTTSPSTPVGTYTITLTGVSGKLTHSTTVQLTVAPKPKPDFAISASPSSQSVGRPGTVKYTVTVTALNGFTGTVTLGKATGLPLKVTQSYSLLTITRSGSSTLKLTTQAGTAAGTYTLTITGKSGNGLLIHSTTVSLTIH